MSSVIWQKSNRAFSWEDVLTTFCATIRCANVFVSASPEARIERLMKLHHISAEDAEDLMEKRTRNVLPITTTTATRHGEQLLPIIYVSILLY